MEIEGILKDEYTRGSEVKVAKADKEEDDEIFEIEDELYERVEMELEVKERNNGREGTRAEIADNKVNGAEEKQIEVS